MKQISVLDMLKVGIGPSSSHTMGPWLAGLRFVNILHDAGRLSDVGKIEVHLYGALALTGEGHATSIAVLLGLSGSHPQTIAIDAVKSVPAAIENMGKIHLLKLQTVPFDATDHMIYHYTESLDFHANGMIFKAFDTSGSLIDEATFFSVGGGFIVMEGEELELKVSNLPYPITFAQDLKTHCNNTGKNIAWIIRENEKIWNTTEQLESKIWKLWEVMQATLYRGCHTEGKLPGGLDVSRRAHGLLKSLTGAPTFDSPELWIKSLSELKLSFGDTLKLVSCLAIATNEENADFGRIVTAPTNGAAGVIPAVLVYYICINKKGDYLKSDIIDFLCVAAEIASIFKKKSTISAAMGGCQAEIGVSSAMAAAALTNALNGTVDQVLMAAEIAMEHHLGLTCDPVGGLVQIPCIERNSMGAIKAITAAQIALSSDSNKAKISLDDVVSTMWETAQDMNTKYKETSLGGLPTNYSVQITEC